MRPLSSHDLVGVQIRCAYEIDLPREPSEEFQARRVVVELASGLRVSTQQDHIIASAPSLPATILAYEQPITVKPSFSPARHPELRSPIARVFQPYGWEHFIGLELENGWVLHDGFSDRDSGLVLYEPAPTARAEFVTLVLPAR